VLRDVHKAAVRELAEILSDELRAELEEMTPEFGAEVPSESALRVAQAQLSGWLQGLFHGIQAVLMAQQAATADQLARLRQRGDGPSPQQKRGYL
jgi:hypothetical protein